MPYREKEKNTEFYLQKRTKHIEENSASLKWQCLIPVCVGERDGGGYKNFGGWFYVRQALMFLFFGVVREFTDRKYTVSL